jgi:hypothetical protein
MNGFHVLVATGLQDAGAIHDGINAGQPRPPHFRRDVLIEVDGKRLKFRPFASQSLRVTNCGDYVVTSSNKAGQKMPANEAVGPGEKNSHALTLSAVGRMAIHRGAS